MQVVNCQQSNKTFLFSGLNNNNINKRMQAQRLELLHYKNAIFHGYLSGLRKHGEAIVLLDNRAVLIASYANDQLSDQAVILLYPDTYFIGAFRNGLLDGPFTVRSPRFSIYSQARMGKVEGEILVVDKRDKRGRVWEIENDEGVCIREQQYDHLFSEEKIAKSLAPYTKFFPSLLEYFLLNNPGRFSLKALKGRQRLDLAMEVRASRRLTVQLERERLVGAGVMAEGFISGLGYQFDKTSDTELEGELQRGQLHGEGTKREQTTNRTIYGRFSRGDIRTLDILTDNNESADSSLNKLKKRIHIHSLEYTNDYINERPVYQLRNFLESVVRNEMNFSQFQREQGSRVNSEREKPVAQWDNHSDQLSQDINELNLINNALRGKR